MLKKIFYIFILHFSILGISTKAQEIIEIEPLFEYPVAPEELGTLTEKSDYLVTHFWDSFDFKNKNAVDQMALNDAFRVYSTPLRWASAEASLQSIDKLISKLSNNPLLLIQFTNAAEENLYGPRAEVWVDEIYLKFLEAALKNKKTGDARKAKWRRQFDTISSSQIGKTPPKFSFTEKNGDLATYFPMSTPTMIIIGDPEDTDWRIARLRLETNPALTDALDKGKVNILFIIPNKYDGWQNAISNYPGNWKVGAADNLTETLDIRILPSIYVIGNDGKILLKNSTLNDSVTKLLEIMN